MKNTELLKAVGNIDDRYIQEAAPHRYQAKQPHKQLFMTLAMAALVLFAFILLPNRSTDVTDANPVIICSSQEEAEEKAGFTIQIPTLPAGTWTYYSDNMIEFRTDKITIRKAADKEDISGDYSDYEKTETIQADEQNVTIRRNGDLVYSAIWQSENYSYAVSWTNGATEADAINVIKQVK